MVTSTETVSAHLSQSILRMVCDMDYIAACQSITYGCVLKLLWCLQFMRWRSSFFMIMTDEWQVKGRTLHVSEGFKLIVKLRTISLSNMVLLCHNNRNTSEIGHLRLEMCHIPSWELFLNIEWWETTLNYLNGCIRCIGIAISYDQVHILMHMQYFID